VEELFTDTKGTRRIDLMCYSVCQRLVVLARVLLVAGIVLGLGSSLTAAPVAQAPAGVRLVPADAAAFLSVRLAEVWKLGSWRNVLVRGDFRERIGLVMDESREEFAQRCQEALGVGIEDIERATVVWPSAENPHLRDVPPEVRTTVIIYTLSRPGLHPKPISGALQQEVRRYRGRTYWTDSDGWTAFYQVDERTFLIGTRSSVEWIIDGMETGGRAGAFAEAVAATTQPALAVFAARPAVLGEAFADRGEKWLPVVRALEPAAAVWGSFSCNLGPRLDLRATFTTSATAVRSCAAAEAAFQKVAEAVSPDRLFSCRRFWSEQKGPEGTVPGGTDFEREHSQARVQLWKAAHDASIRGVGPTLRTSLSASSSFLIAILGRYSSYTLPVLGGDPWYRESQELNKWQLAKAFQKYHADHGCFPPAAVYSKDGKALLSWRVLLLPYLGEAKLFKEFHLDEAWDSPHNRPLTERMPWVYSDWRPTDYRPRPHTYYQVVVGKDSVFEGRRGTAKRKIAGALENTILAVHSNHPVLWTKPEELPLPTEGENRWPEISTAILADGTVSYGPPNPNGDDPLGFDPQTLRSAFSRKSVDRVHLEKAEPLMQTGYIRPQRIIP
jgi:hypothetical protein